MSGEWFPVEIDLPTKSEVWNIAEALGIEPDAVVGKLIRVWGWFDKHTTDGNARVTSRRFIDVTAGVTGFADAMESQGWLVCTAGVITMPKFDVHHGQSAKSRMLNSRRQATFRARKASGGAGSSHPGKPPAPPEKGNDDSNDDVTPPRYEGQDEIVTNKKKRQHTEQEQNIIVRSGERTPFNAFWDAYPEQGRKRKKTATEIWARKKLDAHLEQILADLMVRTTGHGPWLDGFVHNATTYLNGEIWNDPILPRRAAPATVGKLTAAAQAMFDSHPHAPGNGRTLEHDDE